MFPPLGLEKVRRVGVVERGLRLAGLGSEGELGGGFGEGGDGGACVGGGY